MTNKPYELDFLEETHPDGSVKHTYAFVEEDPDGIEHTYDPLNPQEAPIIAIVEGFLSEVNIEPSVLVLRDLLEEQAITVHCSKTDDLPSIINTVLTQEKSCLHYLYSIPSSDALIVGLELRKGKLSPEHIYRTEGTKIVKTK